MLKKSIVLSAIAASALLAGCAPTDFVKTDPQKIAIGKSTWQDVLAASDQEHKPTEATFNDNDTGKEIRVMTFFYGDGANLPGQMIPLHDMSYYFYNNVLVGQAYNSTFDKDSTDFDEEKVPQIKEGVTTKAQVVALLGNPAGNAIYPMAKALGDTELMYLYSHARYAGIATTTEVKSLKISFDKNGIADRVRYNDGRFLGIPAPASRRRLTFTIGNPNAQQNTQ